MGICSSWVRFQIDRFLLKPLWVLDGPPCPRLTLVWVSPRSDRSSEMSIDFLSFQILPPVPSIFYFGNFCSYLNPFSTCIGLSPFSFFWVKSDPCHTVTHSFLLEAPFPQVPLCNVCGVLSTCVSSAINLTWEVHNRPVPSTSNFHHIFCDSCIIWKSIFYVSNKKF